MAKAAKIAASAADVHRVFKIDEQLRKQIKEARDASGLVNRDWLALAVAEQLPVVVAELKAVGVMPNSGKQRPARLPLSDALIGSLKEAAAATTLPQSQLLLLSLARAAAGTTRASAKPKTKRGRKPKSAKA
jgi:hypothetical protein